MTPPPENDEPARSDFWTGKTVLITGASGFIGTALSAALQSRVRSLRLLSRHEPTRLSDRVEWMQADVGDPTCWPLALHGCNVVFHLAAQTDPRSAAEQPSQDWRINVQPLLFLLETCEKTGQRPIVVLAGTETQAGLPLSTLTEEVPDRPATYYDLHKLMAEQYLEYGTAQGLIHGVSLRLSTVYGPGDTKQPRRGVLNRLLRAALGGHHLEIYEGGAFHRDFLYLDDAIHAFMAAAEHIAVCAGRHFLVGSGVQSTVASAITTVAEVARELGGRQVTAREAAPPQPLLAIDRRNVVLDPTAFVQATGWRAMTSLSDGLRRTALYYLQRDELPN